ncbi:hypothetical protein B9Z19DRAFT_1061989 [Tuber borchii]|uniref:Uncharacterized protein n=1 Tax=Tuber borchii TaxID=42251 RepID=A0A2T7A3I0_TUBBO|nr:hypothetical protein B9Z19DRAFT_1061989 [Tuber borchii]
MTDALSQSEAGPSSQAESELSQSQVEPSPSPSVSPPPEEVPLQPEAPQPNLGAVSDYFHGLAVEVDRIKNVPAFNQGAQILPALDQIREDIKQGEVTNGAAHVRDKNNVARLLNGRLSHASHALEPFYGSNGELIPDFPRTNADIGRLNSAPMNALLVALDLSTHGTMPERKARLKRHIGLMNPDA